jgi:tetratricopeptide (TPR) repeat protein
MNRKQRRAVRTRDRSGIWKGGGSSQSRLRRAFEIAARHFHTGRLREAEEACEQVLAYTPGHAEAWFLLGIINIRRRNYEKAITSFQRALLLEPDMAKAHNNLGVAFWRQGQLNSAADCYRKALSIRPDHAEAHNNLGVVLHDQGRLDEAAVCYQRALAIKPDYAEAYNNLGSTLEDQGKLDDALLCLRKAITLKPDYANAHNTLGGTLHAQGQIEEAIACFRRASVLDPDYINAHMNEAFALLLLGDFRDGWNKFDLRLRREEATKNYVGSLWQGEDVPGKVVLLHAEQGLGDTIQFLRFVPIIAERTGRVLVEVPAALRTLAASVEGQAQIFATRDPIPKYDVHCPLLSLPRFLGVTLGTIPSTVPYLSVELSTIERWGGQLAGRKRPRVGLAWAGNPQHKNDKRRSIAFDRLKPLLEDNDISWFSLQVGDRGSDLSQLPPHLVADLAPKLVDFAETAGAIMNLDLVVTVDTAVAHLAGALAKPVWLLLPFVPDWRWLLNRDDSPWYPTMRLFRQHAYGDWDGVISRVKRELGVLVAASK